MSDCLDFDVSPDYPTARRRKRSAFPLGGDRRSQVFMNDPCLPENRRRMRVDPLVDGWDPGEDPSKRARPRRNGAGLPIR